MTNRMLPNLVHFREFQNDPVTGHHYTATCGEEMLATAMVCATLGIETTQQAINLMTSLTREMMSKGWADKPNGASTTAHLKQEAELRGFTVRTSDFNGKSLYQPFDSNLDLNWLHQVFLDLAGIVPIGIEIAHGGQLDSLTGGHDERGVNYHFICIVGIDDQGYWANDGDNSDIAAKLVHYPWSEIVQARPVGLLILEMQEASQGSVKVGVPEGWKDNGSQLIAPNGKVVVQGFRNYVLAHAWDKDNWPEENERGVASVERSNPSLGKGSVQTFRTCRLEWTQARGVFEGWLGQELLTVEKLLATPAASAPAALTDQQQKDLAAVAALREALK